DLVVTGRVAVGTPGRQHQHAQPAVRPAGLLRCEVELVPAGGGTAGRQVQLADPHGECRLRRRHFAHGTGLSSNRFTAVSTAPATSSSGGYSSDRPTTSPLTVGSCNALCQDSNAVSGLSGTSPPSRS